MKKSYNEIICKQLKYVKMFNVRENVSNPSEKSRLQNRMYTFSIMFMFTVCAQNY